MSGRRETEALRCRGERGEVFPVAILFGGVLLTVLIGLHVTIVAVARTAVDSAADRGVTAAQGAPPSPECDPALIPPPTSDKDDRCHNTHRSSTDPYLYCEPVSVPGVARESNITTMRACEGTRVAYESMLSSNSMVGQAEPPEVRVDQQAGVVSVTTYGTVRSPVFGIIEVTGYACGPLDHVMSGGPTPADSAGC